MMRGVIGIYYQLIDLAKIFLMISVICFLPQFLFREKKRAPVAATFSVEGEQFRLGIENISPEYIQSIVGHAPARIALVTQLDRRETNVRLLAQKNIVPAKTFVSLYDLERPISGTDDAAEQQQGEAYFSIDKDGFRDGQLQDVDLLLVDLQERTDAPWISGLLFRALTASVGQQIPIVVLDRPNVLGNKMEAAPMYEAPFGSIPVRSGMTPGELAMFYNARLDNRAKLFVVPMHHYHRSVARADMEHFAPSGAGEIDKMWCLSICNLLAEVAPLDVGLHTPYARQCIALPKSVGMPEQRWYRLQAILREKGIESTQCSFFSNQKQEKCVGLRLHIDEMSKVDSFLVALTVLEFFKHSGVVLGFSERFDRTLGTALVREYIVGNIERQALSQAVNSDLERFYRKAFGSFMYHPLPQPILI